MTPDHRMTLQIARTGQFGDIMRTAIFGQIAIAAVIGFGADGIGFPLIIITIAVTSFGAIGGATALDDVANLREDMDEATAASTYGRGAKARNLDALKMLSAGFLGLIGLAEVLAILF